MSGAVLKGEVHEWTIREQLILASAVQRSGDQNWVSVSRAIKPLVDSDGRSFDYFSQKNCAQQYSAMLDKAGTHKRKRSTEGSAEVAETAGQQIVRELTEKYIKQLNQSLLKTKQEYLAVKGKIERVESGELEDQLPTMLEEMQRESAAAKAAAKSKSTSSSSSLAKPQEQVKQKRSPSSSAAAQAKEVSVVESVSPSKGRPAEELAVKKKLIKAENDIATTESTKASVSGSFPTVTSNAFVSSGLELSSKLPLGVTIKREPTATPSPMDVESPLPHITSSLMASPKEEKFSLPMQTPLPSTPGQISAGDIHVIVQQPNIAALLAEDRTSKTPATKPVTMPVAPLPPPPKSLPSLVLSPSAPVLPNLIQSTVRASSAAVSVLKQPMATSSTGAPLISIPLAASTISLSRTPPASTVSSLPASASSPSLTAALASSSASIYSPITPVATPVTVPATKSPAASSKPSPMPAASSKQSVLSSVSRPSTASSAISTSPLVLSTSKPSVSVKPLGSSSSTPVISVSAPVNRPPAVSKGVSKSGPPAYKAAGGSPASKAAGGPPSSKASGGLSASKAPVVSTANKPAPVSTAISRAPTSQPATSKPVLVNKPTTTTRPDSISKALSAIKPSQTSKFTLSLSKTSSVSTHQSTPVSRPSVDAPTSKPSPGSSTPTLTNAPARPPLLGSGETKQPLPVKPTEKPSLLPSLISSHPRMAAEGVVKTPQALQPTSKPVNAPAPQAPPTVNPVTTPTTGESLVQPSKHVKSSDAPLSASKPVTKHQEGASKVSVSGIPSQSCPPADASGGGVAKGGAEESASLPTTGVAAKENITSTEPQAQPALSNKVPPPPAPVGTKPGASRDTSLQVTKATEKAGKERWKQDPKHGATEQASPQVSVVISPVSSGTPPAKVDSKLTTPLTTPLISVEREVATPAAATPTRRGGRGGQEEDEEEELDEETPVRFSAKMAKSALKKQWNTRSRKRKNPFDEGHSVESTDTEDDLTSQNTSAVSSPAPSQSEVDVENVQSHKQWKKAIIIVWRHAAQHKYANLFLHPVREEDAPGYKNIVLRPIDLSTIKKKIELGLIRTDIEFQRDMLLMFQNAFMYNNSEHEVFSMAQEMKSDVMENIQDYLATQAQLQLMEDTTPSKTLRSRDGRLKETHEEMFSPAKKRRTRADD